MPAFAMCTNDTCPMRQKCRRVTAVPSVNQCYARFTAVVKNGVFICEHYWPVTS